MFWASSVPGCVLGSENTVENKGIKSLLRWSLQRRGDKTDNKCINKWMNGKKVDEWISSGEHYKDDNMKI